MCTLSDTTSYLKDLGGAVEAFFWGGGGGGSLETFSGGQLKRHPVCVYGAWYLDAGGISLHIFQTVTNIHVINPV